MIVELQKENELDAMEKQMEDNFTFVWIIKNFSMYFKEEYLSSPLFVLNYSADITWCIDFYPRGKRYKDYVGIYLARKDDLRISCEVRCNIQLLDCNEEEIPGVKSRALTHVFEEKGSWGYHSFTESFFLTSLINDILVIKYTFKPLSKANDQEMQPSLSYKNGLFTDVVLRARGIEFKVHKAMLLARWPEMAKKLDEEKSSEKDFDIESDVLEAMVKYIYTEKVDFRGYAYFEGLCFIAAKYGLRIHNPTSGMVKTCKTRINTEKISFLWPIENFSSLTVNTELSHKFSVDISKFCKWSLRVHIREKTETDQTFDIFICSTVNQSYEFTPIFVTTKLSFDDVNSSENQHLFEKEENWKFAEFSRTISIDQDDVLLFRCEFKLSDGSFSSETVESSSGIVPVIAHNNLNRSLRNLYENGTLSDMTLVVNSRLFSVHKFILCSQSSVFRRMFEIDMTESRNNQVEISDVDPEIIHDMLLFLYSGDVGTLCEETALQLYAAADKYDISALKKKCSTYLISNITVKYVCKILQLAALHSDDDLYQNALEFFYIHLEEIFSTDEWKEISQNSFCVTLLQDVLVRNKFKKN